MKSIFTILAVLLFSLPLRAVDNNKPFEIDNASEDNKHFSENRSFYSGLVSFSQAAGNSLLYFGAGGIAASALLNYTAERYARPFIIGSFACFTGHVLFKCIEKSAKAKLRPFYPLSSKKVDEKYPNAAAEVILTQTFVDIESAPGIKFSEITSALQPELVSHLNTVKSSDAVIFSGVEKDSGFAGIESETLNTEWVIAEREPIETSSAISNAVQYISKAAAPYFLWWSGKPNTH